MSQPTQDDSRSRCFSSGLWLVSMVCPLCVAASSVAWRHGVPPTNWAKLQTDCSPIQHAHGCPGVKGVTESVVIPASNVSDARGPASEYTCPDCNGSLVSLGGGSFRCRVGHAWTRDALLAARDDEVESALWVSSRSLQEKAKLARQPAETVRHGMLFQRYISLPEETERALSVLGERLAESGIHLGDTGG